MLSEFPNYTIWALALGGEMGPHEDRGKLWPTKKGNLNNNKAEHHLKTSHTVDWVLYYVCYLQYRQLSMNCTRKLVYQLVAWKGQSQFLNCPQKMVLLLKMLTDRLLETTKITPMTAQGGLLIFVRLRGRNILSSVWNSKSWSDPSYLPISILIDPINLRI